MTQNTKPNVADVIRRSMQHIVDELYQAMDARDLRVFDRWADVGRGYLEKIIELERLADTPAPPVQQEIEGTAYTLCDNYTHRRPTGFTLCGRLIAADTWRKLYARVCRELLARDTQRMRELVIHLAFVTSHGKRLFNPLPHFHAPIMIEPNLYTEGNLSANNIRDMIRRLLAAFDIRESEFRVFCR